MWYDGNGWGWGAWLVMALMMVAFWGLLIVGLVALVRYVGGPRDGAHVKPAGPAPGPDRAQDVLAERFARGEIDEDEYRRRRAVLQERQ